MDNRVLQVIKDFLALLHRSYFCLELVGTVKHLLRFLVDLPRNLPHPANLFTGEIQSHLGVAQNVFIKVLDASFKIFIFARDQFCDNRGQHPGKRQPQKGVKNIKESVGIGDLTLDDMGFGDPQVRLGVRRDLINKGDKKGEDEKADNSSKDIKEA